MASVSITIPDAVVPRVRTALRAPYDNAVYMEGQTNPLDGMTDAQAFKFIVGRLVRDMVAEYERFQAAKDAITQAQVDLAGIG